MRRRLAAIRDADLPITWEVLPEVTFANAGAMPDMHEHCAGQRAVPRPRGVRRCRRALAEPAVRTEISVRTGFVEHAYIEPEAGYARRVGDRIEIVACTQTPYMDRDEMGPILGIPATDVRIVPTAVGGGFGGKLDLSVQPLTAIAAWLLLRPGANGLHPPGKHGGDDEAASVAHHRHRRGGSRRQADGVPLSRRFRHRRLCELGGQRSPTACRCMRWVLIPSPTSAARRPRFIPMVRRPGRSAGSGTAGLDRG